MSQNKGIRKSGPRGGGGGHNKDHRKGALPTDRDISGARGQGGGGGGGGTHHEKELVKWDQGGDGVDLDLESDTGKKWDQFEVNQRLFGVQSSFDMNLYTTQLDTNTEWFQRNKEKAERLAAEIERKTSGNTHQKEERGLVELHDDGDDDEESRYSGVARVAPTTAAAETASSPSTAEKEGGGGGGGSKKYVPPQKRGGKGGADPTPAPVANAGGATKVVASPVSSPAAVDNGDASAAVAPATTAPPPHEETPTTPVAASKDSSSASTTPASSEGKKKLSLNPGASSFQPGFKISFSAPPIPKPSSPPPPAGMVMMKSPVPGQQQPLPFHPQVVMGPPGAGFPPGPPPQYQPGGYGPPMAPYGAQGVVLMPRGPMIHPGFAPFGPQSSPPPSAGGIPRSPQPGISPMRSQSPSVPVVVAAPFAEGAAATMTPQPQTPEKAGTTGAPSFRDKLRLAAIKVLKEPESPSSSNVGTQVEPPKNGGAAPSNTTGTTTIAVASTAATADSK